MEESNNRDMAPRQDTYFVKYNQFNNLYLHVSIHNCELFFMMNKIPMQSLNVSVSKKSNVMFYKGQHDVKTKAF